MSDEQKKCLVNPGRHRTIALPLEAVRPEHVPSGVPNDMRCGARLWNCQVCGRFVLSIHDEELLQTPPEVFQDGKNPARSLWMENQMKLQHLLAERASQELPPPWLQLQPGPYWPVDLDQPVAQIRVEEFLDKWPFSFAERLDRALCNLARAARNTPGAPYQIRSLIGDERLASILFSPHGAWELRYVLEALTDRRHISAKPPLEAINEAASRIDLLITPAGWEHIDKLDRRSRTSDQPAFVAMWFGDDSKEETTAFMTDVFNVVKGAAERAGYRAARVDTESHTEAERDFIMNKVLGMIRAAPFVIADLTGNRNGVYFEAGFARGLGIPVIQTCRSTHFEEAHFDVRQIDTKRWKDPEQLDAQVYHHILATLGQGPYVKRDEA